MERCTASSWQRRCCSVLITIMHDQLVLPLRPSRRRRDPISSTSTAKLQLMSILTSTISMRCLGVAFVAACSSQPGLAPPEVPPLPDAALPADAAPPNDAPSPPVEPLRRLDWRTVRGNPFATTAVTVPGAELFALSNHGLVTRSRCQGPDGCTLTWRDLEGNEAARRERMIGVTATSIAPDGAHALLVALDQLERCDDGAGQQFPVARGALQLIDLVTGAASLDLPIRTNQWSAPAFTPDSGWWFAAPITGKGCQARVMTMRSARSPFAGPPGLETRDSFAQAVDPRRWVVVRGPNGDVGTVDPLTPDSFALLENDPSRWDVSRGWLHVYRGFADLAQTVVSIPPTGPMRETSLTDEDWHPFGVMGRWIRVCRILQAEGFRDCRVVDAQHETPPANLRAAFAVDHPDDSVLLGDGAVVYVGPLEDGSRAVQRIALATGQHEVLHPGNGALRSLGDGTAALLLQDGNAWLIEATREELVATRVRDVVSVPQPLPLFGRIPGRQDDVAALVISGEAGASSLAILDVRTRRLATVTDNLFVVAPRGSPFSFDDTCGQPWTTRSAGSVVEGLLEQPQLLYFVELGEPASLWLVPIDLSAPPRRLAELTAAPAACHAPLASPDGSRVGFAETGPGQTTRITLSAE
jgi:hypothetical protein